MVAKREDVSPSEGKSKYGDVTYADETNKKYPLDTEAHARAALSYWGMPKNRAKYSSEDQKKIGARIRSAAKKFGISISDDDGDGKDDSKKSESSLVIASSTYNLEGNTPSTIVYMPKGKWKITPRVNGQPREIEVDVTSETATLLQEHLDKRLNSSVRPYAQFDHKPGPASFLPKSFRWDEERGILLDIEWTESGKRSVTGKDYSYFSPTFNWNDGKVVGLPQHREIGSLTNNPAFTEIQKIAASADADNSKGEYEMVANAVATKLVELQVITADQAAGADDDFIVRAITSLHEALASAQAAHAELTSRYKELEAKQKDQEKSEAKRVIEAAIAEGRIPPKDQELVDFYMDQYLANPKLATKVLAALPKAPIGEQVIRITAEEGQKTVTQGRGKWDIIARQKELIAECVEANPGMSHEKAFNKMKREHPEAFPVEA